MNLPGSKVQVLPELPGKQTEKDPVLLGPGEGLNGLRFSRVQDLPVGTFSACFFLQKGIGPGMNRPEGPESPAPDTSG